MPYSAGVAYLQVIPSFRGVERALRQQAADIGKSVHDSVKDALPDGLAEGGKKAEAEGRKAGKSYSGAFANELRDTLDKTHRDLAEIEIKGNTTDLERAIDRIRLELKEIRDQHVNLELDDETAIAAIRVLRHELRDLNRQAVTIPVHTNTSAALKNLDRMVANWDSMVEERMSRSGTKAADRFTETFRKGVQAAESRIPEIPVGATTREARDAIEEIRKELHSLGKADIGVDLSDREAVARLVALRERIRELHAAAGKDVRLAVNTQALLKDLDTVFDEIHKRELQAAADAQKAADTLAKDHARALGENARRDEAAAKEAQRAADKRATEHARAIAEDRRRDASAARDAAKAQEDLARDHARALAENRRIDDRAATEAQRTLEARERDHRRALADEQKRSADDIEQRMGSFARTFQEKLGKASVAIDVDSRAAEPKLRKIHEELDLLRDKRIGVDISAAEAVAKIRDLEKQLQKLAKGTRDVQVRADVIEAYAALKEIDRVADKLDGRRVNINVDLDKVASGVENVGRKATTSMTQLGALIAAGASLGTAIVPAAAAAVAAIGLIGTAAASVGAGLGVTVLGFVGIGDAVKALSNYQDDAAKSAKSLGLTENQFLNAVNGVADAERSLARARSDAGYAAKRAAQQVEQARRAETRAEQDAKKAQLDLADAIRQVKEEEEDRTLNLRDNALAQQQANLDIAKAKEDLDKIIANPRATKEEREQAQITYQERILQLDKLTVAQRRLQAEQDKFAKTGVQGADKVVAAQQRIADTQQAVKDAQQNVANAISDQRRQQQQSADAIVAAQEHLAESQRTLQQSFRALAATGGDAYQTLQTALGKLSPEGRKFAQFLFGLRDTFYDLRNAASDGLLPGVQTSIESLLPVVPKLRDYISEVSSGIGDIAVRVTKSFGDPSWQRFFKFIANETVPTLNMLTDVTLNVSAGTRDLFLALTAFNKPIGKGLIDMSEAFAKWAAQLEGSSGYQKFLGYVHDVGPDVVDFFINLGRAIVHIVVAAAPVGSVVLHVVDAFVRLIAAIPTPVLTLLVTAIVLVSSALLVTTGILKTFNAVQKVGTNAMMIYNKGLRTVVETIKDWIAAQRDSIRGTGDFTKGLNVVTTAQEAQGKAAKATAVATESLEKSTTSTRRAVTGLAGDLTRTASTATQTYTKNVSAATKAVDDLGAVQRKASKGAGEYSKGLKDVEAAQGGGAAAAKNVAENVDKVGKSSLAAGGAAAGLGAALSGFSVAGLGIAVVIGLITDQMDKEAAKTQENVDAFARLGEAIKKTGSIQSYASQQVIAHDDSVKKLVGDLGAIAKQAGDFDTRLANVARQQGNVTQATELASWASRSYSTDLDTLAQALIGNRDAQEKLLKTLRDAEQAAQLGGDQKLALEAKARREELEKLFGAQNNQLDLEAALQDAMDGTGGAFANANRGLQDYVKSLSVLADAQSSAADKADALRSADDLLFGSQRNLQESMEAQARALRERNTLLNDDNLLNQKGAKTLDIKTEAGAKLTDALEAELTATNDTYRANVQNGVSIEKATKQHDDEVKAIKEAYDAKGVDAKATQHLVDIYGQVPTSRTTDFATEHFGTTQAQLEELLAYQLALREGISLQAARAKIHPDIRDVGGKGNSRGGQLATGGPVRGPGTKTSDDVPAMIPQTRTPFWLSNGEFVQRAAAVDFYGQDVMHALNQQRIPKGLFRIAGYATGGMVSENPVGYAAPQHYPFPTTTAGTRIPSKDEAGQAVRANLGPTGAGPGFLPWPSSPAAQRGDTGVWRSILQLVRSSGIPYTFGNAYRPGDPLWHGSGRAIDFMGYDQDELAQFFIDRLPNVLELIHLTKKGGYFVTRGKRKANFPVQGPLHRNHLHIAMAKGGLVRAPQLSQTSHDPGSDLPPGYALAYSGTGSTERVLTTQQMAVMEQLNAAQPGGGNSYNFTFRDTTLDAARLRAMQERDAVVARTGRAR